MLISLSPLLEEGGGGGEGRKGKVSDHPAIRGPTPGLRPGGRRLFISLNPLLEKG